MLSVFGTHFSMKSALKFVAIVSMSLSSMPSIRRLAPCVQLLSVYRRQNINVKQQLTPPSRRLPRKTVRHAIVARAKNS
jgi:hypothetical protein